MKIPLGFSSRRGVLVGASLALAGLLAAGLFFLLRPLIPSVRRPKLENANVLLITLDTVRADHLGCYGNPRAQTPRLDRLAEEGVLFEHCVTPSAYTLPSHSSILTGTYPPYHGVRINGDTGLADVHTTLTERLKSRGYRTGAFVGAFVLDGRWGLEQGFDHYDDDFQLGPEQRLDLAGVQRPANVVADAAMKWLGETSAKPFFAWVHFYDAHSPYEPPEPFRSRFAAGNPESLYDGEIAFADSQVGRILDWLSAHGLDENTIVVVVGDHGEGLGSHGESEHGYYIYDYAVRVPFLVRLPSSKVAGRRIADQVRTVDILPTILDLLAMPSEQTLHGKSVWPMIAGGEPAEPRYAYSESVATRLQYGWSALYSVRTKEYKFIEAPHAELYELQTDPDEKSNRFSDLRRVTTQLRATLNAIRKDIAQGAPDAAEANLDQETMAKLSSLGYLGGSSASLDDDATLADPKEKLHLFDSVGYAAHLISVDDHKQAAEVLRIVLEDDPEVPQAQLLLASTYRKTGELAKAKEILDRFLRKDAGNPRALIAMAEILSDEGKGDDVMAICRRALAEDERNARAWELMADVHIKRSEHEQALPLLRKVVEIQPKLTRSRINLAAALVGVGELGEAEKLLADILSTNPKFPLARYHQGLLRENQGRLPEAREAYEAEVANHPQSLVARFNLGNLLMRLGDRAGAESQMRAVIQQDPKAARAYLMLGRALLDRPEHLQEAEQWTRQGLERTNEHELQAFGYFLLADIYARQGRRSELAEALRQARHHQALVRAGTRM